MVLEHSVVGYLKALHVATYIVKIHVTIPGLGARKKLRVNSEREVESFDEQGRSVTRLKGVAMSLLLGTMARRVFPGLKAFCKVTSLECTTCRDTQHRLKKKEKKKKDERSTAVAARFLQLINTYDSLSGLLRR